MNKNEFIYNEKMIDLHTHTSASDGELSPKEIVDLAMEKNLKTIAITDHDTIFRLIYPIKIF